MEVVAFVRSAMLAQSFDAELEVSGEGGHVVRLGVRGTPRRRRRHGEDARVVLWTSRQCTSQAD